MPGSRKEKVLLVAHADTVWTDDSIFWVVFKENGIGADDRAGCAILWLLKDTGHSLLLTDDEENYSLGAKLLKNDAEYFDRINREHNFMIEFDHGKCREFKCYDIGRIEFREYIKEMMPGFTEPDKCNSTDIRLLCRDICGVNLSAGYYKEHTPLEYMDENAWKITLDLTRKWLSYEHFPRYKPVAEIDPEAVRRLKESDELIRQYEEEILNAEKKTG